MRHFSSFLIFVLASGPALAEAVTTLRAIRPATVVAEADLTHMVTDVAGAYTEVADVVGLEARVTLYPGRPIRPEDVGPPALVQRNQFVPLVFQRNNLLIMTEGRALGRGAAGDWIRVMNTASKSTVTGRVMRDGRVLVMTN